MKSVLIVTQDTCFYERLAGKLQDQLTLLHAADCESGLMELSFHHISALVLDMEIPGGDGITFMEEAGDTLPEQCIVMGYFASPFACQKVKDLGASCYLLKPCSTAAVVSRLTQLLTYGKQEKYHRPDLQNRTAVYLSRLGIPTQLDGYTQLRIGIPLYLQDTAILLNKELYPAIANLTGFSSGEVVERSIRNATKTARNTVPNAWIEMFPKCSRNAKYCPSNKEVISKIAQLLMLEDVEKPYD